MAGGRFSFLLSFLFSVTVPSLYMRYSAFYSTSSSAEAELAVLLITISAATYLMILIIEIEDMRQLLLDGGNAARVLAVDHVL